MDLLLDLFVPSVARAQSALIEPNLDAERPQRIGDAARGRGVFARVAEEDRGGDNVVSWVGHEQERNGGKQ